MPLLDHSRCEGDRSTLPVPCEGWWESRCFLVRTGRLL
jgi:hypothetical protein